MQKDRAKEIERLVKDNPNLTGKEIEELYESEITKDSDLIRAERLQEAEAKADSYNTKRRCFVYKKTNDDDEIVELTFWMFENFMVNPFSNGISVVCDYEELVLNVHDELSFDNEVHYASKHTKYEGYDVTTFENTAKFSEEINESVWDDITSEINLLISKTMLRFSL